MTRREILLLALLTAALLILVAPVLTYPLGLDQGTFAVVGRGLLEGRVPYVDLWDTKPPAVFYVYAGVMGLFGRTVAAIRAIDLLIFPAIALSLYWLGRRLANCWVAVLAVVGFAAFYFSETFWTLTQNDGIALLPMILAAALTLKVGDDGPHPWRWAFGAGACSALTLWFKYPFVFFVLSLVIAHVWMRLARRDEALGYRRRLLIDAAGFAAGGLLVGLGGMAYLASIGALDAMIQSALTTAQYSSLSDPVVTHAGIAERWSRWWPLVILSGVGLLTRLRASQADGDGLPHGWSVIWLWLLAGLGIVVIQGKAYDYHWLPMLPPLLLIAAAAFHRLVGWSWRLTEIMLRGRLGQWLWLGAVYGGVIGTLLLGMAGTVWGTTWPYLRGEEDQATFYGRFQAGDFLAEQSLAVTEYLAMHTAPGDSLYIWGYRTDVYFLSQLEPATRFIVYIPLVTDWSLPAWKQENVDVLWADLPPYVLVMQRDEMPWITGRHADSHTLLQDYTELNNWLMFNYERVEEIDSFIIWRRK